MFLAASCYLYFQKSPWTFYLYVGVPLFFWTEVIHKRLLYGILSYFSLHTVQLDGGVVLCPPRLLLIDSCWNRRGVGRPAGAPSRWLLSAQCLLCRSCSFRRVGFPPTNGALFASPRLALLLLGTGRLSVA